MEAGTHTIYDKWTFLFLYPLITFLSVHLGNDNSFKELIEIPSYYTDLILALVFSYSTGFYLKYLYRNFDLKFDWGNYSVKRLILQFVLGVLLPVAVIIGLEIVYLLLALNIPLSESSVFYLELPLAFIFITFLNLLYTFLHYKKFISKVLEKAGSDKNQKPEIKTRESLSFIVHFGSESLNISGKNVAYFIILEGCTYLLTKEGKKFVYNVALDKLNNRIAGNDFFKLNRQVIARRDSIVSFERTDSRKLKINLSPEPDNIIYVSKSRANEFQQWLALEKRPFQV